MRGKRALQRAGPLCGIMSGRTKGRQTVCASSTALLEGDNDVFTLEGGVYETPREWKVDKPSVDGKCVCMYGRRTATEPQGGDRRIGSGAGQSGRREVR
jgi:hypothetical protein